MTASRQWFRLAAGLLLIMAVGACFRLAWLDRPALRADTLEFWRICQQTRSFGQVMADWDKLLPGSGQLPFPVAWTKGFLNVFHLPLTHFTLRLPAALWGILAIPAAYLLGLRLRGVRLGIWLAALTALNPYHIQVSREAYYYPPMIVGALLLFGGLFECWRVWPAGGRLPARSLVLHVLGFLLFVYSQPSGWPTAFLCVCAIAGMALWTMIRAKRARSDALLLLALFGAGGLPLLGVSWGLRQMLQFSGAVRDYWAKVFMSADQPLLPMVGRTLTSFAWGDTPWGLALTIVAGALGLGVILRGVRREGRLLLLPAFIVIGFVLFNFSRQRTGFGAEPRYVLALWPAYLGILGLGLAHGLEGAWTARRPALQRRLGLLQGGLLGAALLAWLYPALLCTRLTGKPTPYKELVAWCDAHLPRGTPVLVDRMYEPYFELAMYPASNVIFTITVQDEPMDVYVKNRWRETAPVFFQRHPDAAFMELVKQYWTVPSIGPWRWPREHFARHIAITNEAGLKLRRLGVAHRSDFYHAFTNRLVTEIFYNLPEDLVAQARREGRPTLVLYGEGWGFDKSQDFHDWRVLKKAAGLTVYNLADTARPLVLELTAVSPAAHKTLRAASGATCRFERGKLTTWRLALGALASGEHRFVLTDMSGPAAHDAPLWVDQVRLLPDVPVAAGVGE